MCAGEDMAVMALASCMKVNKYLYTYNISFYTHYTPRKYECIIVNLRMLKGKSEECGHPFPIVNT